MTEPGLFATQEPVAEAPPPPTPTCPECRLPMDKAHAPEKCADWTAWRRKNRAHFESFMLTWERDLRDVRDVPQISSIPLEARAAEA